MITRKNRFHGHNSLRYTYQHGATIRGTLGTLKYARNSRRTTYRMTVVVSKKVSKSAVVRNRIRRRVYEAVRRTIAPNQPYDLIFTAFSDRLAIIPADELNESVLNKLREARIGTMLQSPPTRQDHDIVDHKEI